MARILYFDFLPDKFNIINDGSRDYQVNNNNSVPFVKAANKNSFEKKFYVEKFLSSRQKNFTENDSYIVPSKALFLLNKIIKIE